MEKFNFLDKVVGFKAGSENDITDRIKKALQNCPKYDLTRDNCEHLATYVRYGKKLSLQTGTIVEGVMALRKETKEILRQVKENADKEKRCLKKQ